MKWSPTGEIWLNWVEAHAVRQKMKVLQTMPECVMKVPLTWLKCPGLNSRFYLATHRSCRMFACLHASNMSKTPTLIMWIHTNTSTITVSGLVYVIMPVQLLQCTYTCLCLIDDKSSLWNGQTAMKVHNLFFKAYSKCTGSWNAGSWTGWKG